MIGHLKGNIIYKNPPEILLQANGVGYEVALPLNCFGEIGELNTEIEIYIHTLVREDIFQLYGFTQIEQRSLFRELIKVNGIGAKMAIAILSSMSVSEFYICVENRDSIALTKLPGVGKKTAERLLLDMQDKLKNLNITSNNTNNQANQINLSEQPFGQINQAVSALVSLGYKANEANKAIEALSDKNRPLPELIKLALQNIK
jgi:Holliday junction DNA helicase RuvA